MTIIAGTFNILENWEITSKDLDGNILCTEKVCNLITDSGLNMARDLIGGLNGQPYIHAIAIGTGATAPVNGNTALQIEFTRNSVTTTSPENYQVQFQTIFSFGSGISETITEAGLFDSITVSGSNLLARTTFVGQVVNAGVVLTITATITFSRT